jgi:hypothetical protein
MNVKVAVQEVKKTGSDETWASTGIKSYLT